MIWLLGLLMGLGVLLAAPFIAEACRPQMGARPRRDAPGGFAHLSRGVTHYRWIGAAQGPVAVCVHGLTTPSFVWVPIAQGLGRLGYRVLIYDLYGRGYSDRPKGVQDADFFVRQLEDILKDQGIEDDITLLGYSMGGAIATAFAARFPQRLRRLILLAPAGFGHDLGPMAQLVVNHPRLGRWLMMACYGRSFRQATETERRLQSSVENIVDLQQAELKYRGFRPAVLSSMQGMLDGLQEAAHRRIAGQGVPVGAIWAREDEVIPVKGLDRLAQWNGAAQQRVIAQAGHAVAYTHTQEVLKAMRDLIGTQG